MARVLVVDDDPDIIEAVDLVLGKAGYEVCSAGSRSEGMRAVTAFKPALVILDVMMEEQDDGIAMAQDLRRQGVKTPILMMTSISRVVGYQYGADSDLVPVDDYLEKPVEPATLVAKVKALLEGKEN